jgi:hypothetical protein
MRFWQFQGTCDKIEADLGTCDEPESDAASETLVGVARLVGAVHLVGEDTIVDGAPYFVGIVHLVGGATLLVAPYRVWGARCRRGSSCE